MDFFLQPKQYTQMYQTHVPKPFKLHLKEFFEATAVQLSTSQVFMISINQNIPVGIYKALLFKFGY